MINMERVAVVSLVDPSVDHARMLHAFEYIFDLMNNGIQAQLFLDGASVKIVDFVYDNPSDIIKPLYDRAIKDGLLEEACNFCASAYKVKEKIVGSNIKLSPENHHISIARLIKEGYRIITL
jgi:hypothetical protein